MGRMRSWLERRRWGRVLITTFQNADRDKIGPVVGGIAFYGLLGLLPALIALVALVGLVFHGQRAEGVIDLLSQSVPGSEGDLIKNQLGPLSQGSNLTLSAAFVLGSIGGIWAASTAVQNAFVAMEVAYGVEKGRGYWPNRGIALLFTLAVLVLGFVLLLGLVALPSVARAREFSGIARFAAGWGRWPFLAAAAFGTYLFIYRYGIRRERAQIRKLLVGAGFATVIWLLGSILFTLWLTYIVDYGAFYGTLSTLVVGMVWLLLSGFALMLGAEMNVVLEHGDTPQNVWVKEREKKGEAIEAVGDRPSEDAPAGSKNRRRGENGRDAHQQRRRRRAG